MGLVWYVNWNGGGVGDGKVQQVDISLREVFGRGFFFIGGVLFDSFLAFLVDSKG